MTGASKAVGSDEVRDIPNGKVEIATVGDVMVGRATFQPGWRWSESVKPIAGTDSCEVQHNGYCISGRLGIKMDDGTEFEVGPGEAYTISPGHDGWVVGNEPYVGVDFAPGMAGYAKK
jgi:uncharacterized cupin superfamily protein